MKQIVVLTGAGISAESGLKTFRDANGLWEGHDIYEVATPEGFQKNPALVLDFYNKRRRQLLSVKPNAAHLGLVQLEKKFKVNIITQNVDDLHERAGSSSVLHLHGELLKARSTFDPKLVYPWLKDMQLGDCCPHNSQLRPHIVWFGEDVPLMDKAIELTSKAEILIIIGTSMQVYPAAGLINYINKEIPVYFIDPNPAIDASKRMDLRLIDKPATQGVSQLISEILNE